MTSSAFDPIPWRLGGRPRRGGARSATSTSHASARNTVKMVGVMGKGIALEFLAKQRCTSDATTAAEVSPEHDQRRTVGAEFRQLARGPGLVEHGQVWCGRAQRPPGTERLSRTVGPVTEPLPLCRSHQSVNGDTHVCSLT